MDKRGLTGLEMLLVVTVLGLVTTWIVAVSQPDTITITEPPARYMPHIPAK